MGKRFTLILALAALAGTSPLWFAVLAYFEGRLLPVVGELRITRMQPEADDYGLIWVTFKKRRSCEYLGVNFFDVTQTPMHRVRVDLRPNVPADDTYSNLPVGEIASRPWRVYMPPQRIIPGLYAVVSHRCNPFWITQSVYRDPR